MGAPALYRGAREVQRALKRVTGPICGTLSARGNAAARKVLERFQEQNRGYDEETRHGRNEGVGWPVPANAGEDAGPRDGGAAPAALP